MLFRNLERYTDAGLLILRIVIGAMFLFYGGPRLFGGYTKWVEWGHAMSTLSINFGFGFWGFLAAFIEFFGGLCLIFGFLFRAFCFLLFLVMCVAINMHFHQGDGLMVAGHAIELASVFLGLVLIGPGKFSLDRLFRPLFD